MPVRQGRERADAARNRSRILAAADRLLADRGPAAITMEDVARAAGVGRATVYRRFPDPAAIAVALLDQHERALQEQMLRGAPPLGPGAPPGDRLAAFYTAYADLRERHLHLALGAEVGRSRFAIGAYGFWRAHVRALVAEAGVPDPDALTDQLLASLSPDLYAYQREQLGLSQRRITAALTYLATTVLG